MWVRAILLRPEDIDPEFERQRFIGLLRPIEERFSGFSAEATVNDALAEKVMLFAVVGFMGETRGAMVIRPVRYPSGWYVLLVEAVSVPIGSKRLDQECVRRIANQIEEMARSMGCDAVRFYGRAGWNRILSEYDIIDRVYEKALGVSDG